MNNNFIKIILVVSIIIIIILVSIIINLINKVTTIQRQESSVAQLEAVTGNNAYISTAEHLKELNETNITESLIDDNGYILKSAVLYNKVIFDGQFIGGGNYPSVSRTDSAILLKSGNGTTNSATYTSTFTSSRFICQPLKGKNICLSVSNSDDKNHDVKFSLLDSNLTTISTKTLQANTNGIITFPINTDYDVIYLQVIMNSCNGEAGGKYPSNTYIYDIYVSD